jgi:hypothetical protein
MAIVVVGGSARGAGKTTLVCGIVAALKERRWTAVKITPHAHGAGTAVREGTVADPGSDTGRYLAAGAERALLIGAQEEQIEALVKRLLAEPRHGENAPGTNLIFESNRVLRYIRPDVCLAIDAGAERARKPSFELVAERCDATVMLAEDKDAIAGEKPWFQLKNFEQLSAEMAGWLRQKLAAKSGCAKVSPGR